MIHETLWRRRNDVRLADHNVREVAVGPITAYGKTLDRSASPRDVVYVFLQAVVADYDAGSDQEARERAFDIQLSTCAPRQIKEAAAHRRDLSPQQRRERLYSTVRRWAPVLGFYRDDFRVDFPTLRERMHLVITPEQGGQPTHAQVFLNVAHPDPERNPQAGAVAHFLLVTESGYWRIWWVGWNNSTRNWKEVPPRGVAVRMPAKSKATSPTADGD